MPAPEWVGRDEYPQDKDMDTYGDKSSWDDDDDPLTIGYVDSNRHGFWTTQRLVMVAISLTILTAILLSIIRPTIG